MVLDLSGRRSMPLSGSPDERPRPARPASASRLFNPDIASAALVALATVGLLLYFTGPICPDVSWQFWLAHAMRRGARLYTDFVEINPPLWFWMAVPLDWLAETLRVRTEPVAILTVALWVLLAVNACRRLLAGEDARRLTLFLLYMIGILLIVPMQITEQREHLALIGAVPYLVLAAERRQSRAVPAVIAVLVGIAAAVGLALKPHFLAVPLLTEVWLWRSLRRDWRPLRSETIALAGVGALYLLAVILFAPRFLTEVLPRLFPVYGAAAPYVVGPPDVLPFTWFFMLLGIAPGWRAILGGKAPLATAFLIGFVGFAFSYFAQQKGWLYQGLPATGCLALALAALVMEQGWPTSPLRLFLPALLLWPLGFMFAQLERPITPNTDITPAFSTLQPGDAFGLVSIKGPTNWPSMVDRGLVNASRYGQYWVLVAFEHRPNDPLVRNAAVQAVRQTALDYRCLPPKVIVFTRFDRRKTASAAADPYPFFMRDPAFADVLSHYRLSQSYGIVDAYRLAEAMPPIDRRLCRHAGVDHE
jgi:hypothetical protein